MRGRIGGYDFHLIGAVGNLGCVKGVRLFVDFVLEESPDGLSRRHEGTWNR